LPVVHWWPPNLAGGRVRSIAPARAASVEWAEQEIQILNFQHSDQMLRLQQPSHHKFSSYLLPKDHATRNVPNMRRQDGSQIWSSNVAMSRQKGKSGRRQRNPLNSHSTNQSTASSVGFSGHRPFLAQRRSGSAPHHLTLPTFAT
jgi:hypothetical protein